MLLPCELSGTRLLAFGASSALHMLALAALASLLDYRSGLQDNHAPTLTVVSLEPDRPSAKPKLPRHPEEQNSYPEPAPPRSAGPVPVAGAPADAPGGLIAPTAPSPEETAKLSEDPMSETAAPPRHTAGTLDTALSEYQASLWRKLDANRPRGATMKGTVLIRFRLLADGTLLTAQVSQSSGNILLDRIVLRSVRQAAPFPRPPGSIPPSELVFEIPITIR